MWHRYAHLRILIITHLLTHRGKKKRSQNALSCVIPPHPKPVSECLLLPSFHSTVTYWIIIWIPNTHTSFMFENQFYSQFFLKRGVLFIDQQFALDLQFRYLTMFALLVSFTVFGLFFGSTLFELFWPIPIQVLEKIALQDFGFYK